VNATKRFRARLHEVTQQWLRELVGEVVAAHTPAPGRGGRFRRRVAAAGKLTTSVLASAVSPRKVKRRRRKKRERGDWPSVESALESLERQGLVERVPALSNESAKPEPAAASLHLLAPSRSVEKGAVITASPVATVAKPAKREVVRRIGKSAPEPRRSEAFIGMPRPLAALKPLDELAERGRRGAEAAKASRATERALGPTPKLSKSDRELEAWAAERLAAGDLPAEMTIPRDELDEPAEAPTTDRDDEEDEG
jgi:hypothetical protein